MNKLEDCAFELSYLKKEHEISNGELIAEKRIKHGELLGELHPVDADYVIPIPETAIHYSQGYSIQTKIPLTLAIFKNRPKPKTLFINNRKKVIKDIFTVIPRFIQNKRIVLIDETVISGLSLVTILNKIKIFEPKELHLRLANPPMIRGCPSSDFGNNWRFEGKNLFEISLLNSIEYLSLDQISKFSKCFYCFGGKDDHSKMVGY